MASANRINTRAKCERVIENSVRCVCARYDVQTLTIPGPSQVRQTRGCVTTGSSCSVDVTSRHHSTTSLSEKKQ
jgi:hypothetical protein